MDPYFTQYTKINIKWTPNQKIHLNIIAKSIKLLEENTSTLCDLGLGKSLVRYNIQSTSDKRKKHKLDLIKIKNVCASKDTIKKVKRQPRKYGRNHMSDKVLLSRICKEFIEHNNKKKNNPV